SCHTIIIYLFSLYFTSYFFFFFFLSFFFFNDPATTEIYTLSLHDALPISLHEMPSYDTRAGKVCQIRWARFREMQRVPRRSASRSEEHTSELQSPCNLVCRLLLEKKKKKKKKHKIIK